MLVRLRLSVPDRPGGLGRLASALGSAHADIARVEVLERESGRAVDDVFVELRDAAHLTRVRAAVTAVPGVEVLGTQHPAPPVSGHAELELVSRLVDSPAAVVQVLADGAPGAVGADWAAVLDHPAGGPASRVLARSTRCPEPDAFTVSASLKLAAVTVLRTHPQGEAAATFGGAALAPLGPGIGLLVVRENGPTFHRAELWRLGQLAAAAGALAVREAGG